jgi:hypothetical protein
MDMMLPDAARALPAEAEFDDRRLFLATAPAGRRDWRLASAVVVLSILIFAAILPVAGLPLAKVSAFIPSYESVLAVNDLVTAFLLFGQFGILRSRAILVLGGGYLFTALIAIIHALTYPGVFSETGLLGAGPQTTAWLFMFWHGGFPLVVILYALLKPKSGNTGRIGGTVRAAIAWTVLAVLGAVAAAALIATVAEPALPALVTGIHYAPAMLGIVSTVWALSMVALLLLWLRRPHAVLDLWLIDRKSVV